MSQVDTASRATTVVEDQADRYGSVGDGAAYSARAHLGY